MRAASRATLATALVAGVALGAFAHRAAAAPAPSPVVGALHGCLRQSSHLLVLDLIDESGSLRQTDTSNARVVGVKAQLAGLAKLAATPVAGRHLDVEVRLVTFASGYRALWDEKADHPQWRSVDPSNRGALMRLADVVATRNSGRDTDYGTALERARADLAARSAALTVGGGAPPCQALVWFTDGRYDIEPRVTSAERALGTTLSYAPGISLTTPKGTAVAVRAGRRMLCRPGGLLDRFRRDDVRFFTVALDSQMQPAAQRFLRSATQGRAAGTRCGAIARPDTGLYLSASDGRELLYLFGGLFDTPAQVEFCPRRGQGYCSFATYAGLSGFSLMISTPATGDAVELTDPAGRRVVLSPTKAGSARVGGVPLVVEWFSPTALGVDATFPASASGWVGRWRLSFVQNGAPARGQGRYVLRLRSSLLPSLIRTPSLVLGRSTPVRLGFVDAGGRRVASSPLLDRASLAVAAVDPRTGRETSLPVRRLGTGAWQTSYAPPLGTDATQVELRLRAKFAPTPRVSLSTQEQDVQVPLVPPPAYPRIATRRLDLPSVRGTHTTKGVVVVVGPDHGTGCVWSAGAAVTLPTSEVTRASMSPSPRGPPDCLHVAAGARREITVRFHPPKAATGRAQGRVLFRLRGTSGHVVSAAVPVGFDMRPKPNAARAIATFVILLVAGILLPFLLLIGLNWLGARFQPPQLVRYLLADVTLRPDGFVANGRLLDTSPAAFTGAEHVLLNEKDVRPQRSLEVDGFRFDARALGARGERRFSIFRGPYGVVSASAPAVAAGSPGSPLQYFEESGHHQVPLGLARTWIFAPTATVDAPPKERLDVLAREPDRPPLRGRLLLLVPTEATTHGQGLARLAKEQLEDQFDAVTKRASSPARGLGQAGRLRAWIGGIRARRESATATQPVPEPSDDDLFNPRR